MLELDSTATTTISEFAARSKNRERERISSACESNPCSNSNQDNDASSSVLNLKEIHLKEYDGKGVLDRLFFYEKIVESNSMLVARHSFFSLESTKLIPWTAE